MAEDHILDTEIVKATTLDSKEPEDHINKYGMLEGMSPWKEQEKKKTGNLAKNFTKLSMFFQSLSNNASDYWEGAKILSRILKEYN